MLGREIAATGLRDRRRDNEILVEYLHVIASNGSSFPDLFTTTEMKYPMVKVPKREGDKGTFYFSVERCATQLTGYQCRRTKTATFIHSATKNQNVPFF